MGNLELWKKAFDIFLNKGDVYSYDYEAAVKEIEELGITIQSKPSMPETKEAIWDENYKKHIALGVSGIGRFNECILNAMEEYAARSVLAYARSQPPSKPESVEGEFVGQDQSWYCGRKVRTYRGNGVVTGNKTNDTDFIRVDLGYGDHQHWYKEELELITDEPALQSEPSMPETKDFDIKISDLECDETKWNEIYSTPEWATLKWDMGSIFTQWISLSESGSIEGNPAIHRMAQYAHVRESELRSINESLRNERNQLRQRLEDMEEHPKKKPHPDEPIFIELCKYKEIAGELAEALRRTNGNVAYADILKKYDKLKQ